MELKGYKAFNGDLTNNYGDKFEEGKTYHLDGNVKFGVDGYGFHFCKNIEDTFRYINDPNIKVAKVTASGKIVESSDEYNEYFDMYASDTITIDHIMTREEIIREMLGKTENKVCRFIMTGFKLSDDEIKMFRAKFYNSRMVSNYLDYYMLGDKEVFNRSFNEYVKKR